MGRLNDKVALISGGAGDLGAAAARRFVEEGAFVVIADLREAEAAKLAQDLGERAASVELDVTSEDSWSNAAAKATAERGRLDVLVNGAGIIRMGPLTEMPLDDYHAVIAVNQTGTFLGMRAAIPAMASAGGGSIVNVSSGEGLMGTPGAGAYTASKHAVVGLTKTGALELAPLGIRVNAVCPGGVEGSMLDQLADDVGAPVPQVLAGITPLRRLARPQEVADLVLYLAGDESAYCSGGTYLIDGGLLAGITLDPS